MIVILSNEPDRTREERFVHAALDATLEYMGWPAHEWGEREFPYERQQIEQKDEEANDT